MKKAFCLILVIAICLSSTAAAFASSIEREETPEYKVAFYAATNYHLEDEDGIRSGYGYDMMQTIESYLQASFRYVGYDCTPNECEKMLEKGEIDIYTAAKITPERKEKFAFSAHPSISSTTRMNVKAGNTQVVSGDYETYNGLRVGLLAGHTYNNTFIDFTEEKGIKCNIVYFDNLTELNQALIEEEVDAVVNSYIRIPEDEITIENFGKTSFYFMARKEDKALLDMIDHAIDRMNLQIPNWRTDLYYKYYGTEPNKSELMEDEWKLLNQLKAKNTVLRAVQKPNAQPYSWYEKGEAMGIAADMFRATAKSLGLSVEIVPVNDMKEYEEVIKSGEIDIIITPDEYDDLHDEYDYELTDSYLSSTLSVIYHRSTEIDKKKIVTFWDTIPVRNAIKESWPDAEVIIVESIEECMDAINNHEADGAVLPTYTAQELARNDIRGHMQIDILPGFEINFCMGVHRDINYAFYGIWQKALLQTAEKEGANILQAHAYATEETKFLRLLFDHPEYMILFAMVIMLLLFFILAYIQTNESRKREKRAAAQLAVALSDAQKAVNAKQDFFSKMSHDIRTPLNVVLGMTQVAQKYKDDPEKLDNALQNIANEGQQLLTMIDSIMDVNQLEHSHIELQESAFSPYDSMSRVIDMLLPLAKKKGQTINLVSNCEESQSIVIGDENRFIQIMMNLLSNAVKYTGNDGKISLIMGKTENGTYQFICEDNGIGMPQDFIEHICEEYMRAEDSRVSKIQGTGLGMAVVKGLTELMGGKLRVESQLGVGSTFIVELPFRTAKVNAAGVSASSTHISMPQPECMGKRVLLAEDNELNAEIAVELMETLGFVVEHARNGEEAVSMFEKSPTEYYDAIFMDMQMPVLDGVSATKKIRSSLRTDCTIPIYAMTANSFTDDRIKCESGGMNGFITKPFTVGDILAAFREKRS